MPLIARWLTQVGALARPAGVSAEGTYGSFQSFLSYKPFLKPLLTPSRRAQQLQRWSSVVLHLILSVYIRIYLFIWVTTTLRRSCSKSLLPLVSMFQKNLLIVKCCSLFLFLPENSDETSRHRCARPVVVLFAVGPV